MACLIIRVTCLSKVDIVLVGHTELTPLYSNPWVTDRLIVDTLAYADTPFDRMIVPTRARLWLAACVCSFQSMARFTCTPSVLTHANSSWNGTVVACHCQSRMISSSSSGPWVLTAQNLATAHLVSNIALKAATMSAISCV
jgi:hypothetical protein